MTFKEFIANKNNLCFYIVDENGISPGVGETWFEECEVINYQKIGDITEIVVKRQ